MRNTSNAIIVLFVLFVLFTSGCASHFTQPDEYSGFIVDYKLLKQTKSATGASELFYISPDYIPHDYDSIIYTPVIYYPEPLATNKFPDDVMEKIRNYTDNKLQTALAHHKKLVGAPGANSLIFRSAISRVSAGEKGLQFYEILPIALVIVGTQYISGHRTMETHLYYEAELIDARTGKVMMQVVRKGQGENLSNKSTPLTLQSLKQVIDNLAADIAGPRVTPLSEG